MVRGVKRLEREADHSPQSSAEIKNAWSYTSALPCVSMSWSLIKRGESCLLTGAVHEGQATPLLHKCQVFQKSGNDVVQGSGCGHTEKHGKPWQPHAAPHDCAGRGQLDTAGLLHPLAWIKFWARVRTLLLGITQLQLHSVLEREGLMQRLMSGVVTTRSPYSLTVWCLDKTTCIKVTSGRDENVYWVDWLESWGGVDWFVRRARRLNSD
jgi:hypothetical protein